VPKSLRKTKLESPDPTPPAANLNERKQQFVRDAIWNAAIDLFAQKGFGETTVDDITQAAGTSKRSFFRYFESKSDLMVQPIASFGNSVTEAIKSCPSTDSLPDVLRDVVLRVVKHSASMPQTRRVMEIAAKYPAARSAQLARVAELQDSVVAAYAQWGAANGLSPLKTYVIASLTMSLLNVTYRSWFEQGEDISLTAERVFQTFCEIVCGVRKPSKSRKPD